MQRCVRPREPRSRPEESSDEAQLPRWWSRGALNSDEVEVGQDRSHRLGTHHHRVRCNYCFLKCLCHDHMFAYRERLVDGTFERVRIDLDVETVSQRAAMVLDNQRPEVLHVQGTETDILHYLVDHPYQTQSDMQVVVEPRTNEDLASVMQNPQVSRMVVRGLTSLECALAVGTEHTQIDVEVVLDSEIVAWIGANSQHVGPWIAADRLFGRLSNFETISAVKENGVGPDELRLLAEIGVRLVNVPTCLGGAKVEEGAHYVLSRDLLDEQGNLSVTPYVQRYIEGEYYKKSLRCKDCSLHDRCRGMHIGFLRTHGFSVLQPVGSLSEQIAC